MITRKGIGLSIVATILAFNLAACSFSVEQAAINQIAHLGPAPQSGASNASNAAVLQKQSFDGIEFVMLAWETNSDGVRYECLGMVLMKWHTTSWESIGGSAGCAFAEGVQDPFTVHSGTNQVGQELYTFLYGQVFDPQVETMRMKRLDEEQEEVEVRNQSYMVLNVGLGGDIQIEGIDQDGKIIQTFKVDVIETGKE